LPTTASASCSLVCVIGQGYFY